MPSDAPMRPWAAHAIPRLLDTTEQLLFVDPGGGKTRVLLEAFHQAREGFDAERLLVIAPKKVAANTWPAEIEKWGYDFTWQVLTTQTEVVEPVDVWLTHFEALPWLFGHPNKTRRRWIEGAWNTKWPCPKPDWLYVDEIHRLKKASGVRAKTLNRYAHEFTRRTGGTGSPASNGYEGLHGIVKAVDLGQALGSVDPADGVFKEGITRFRHRFFHVEPRGGWQVWVPNDGAREEIQERIRPLVVCVTDEDWAEELPHVESSTHLFELPAHAREQYQLMREEAVLEAGGRDLLFAEEATNSKLRQIANGCVYTAQTWEADRSKYTIVHTAKLEALENELIRIGMEEETASPTIVVYEFKHDKAEIEARFQQHRWEYETLDGTDDYEVIRRWNRGEVPILLMYPAEGLNLQEGGHHIVWYTIPHDWKDYDQMNRRLVRMGQPNDTVYVHHLAAEDTVEQRIARRLDEKAAEENGLKEGLKQ